MTTNTRTPLQRAVFEDGRSIKAIAEAAGIHPVTLSRIVNGASCSDATAQSLARTLDVPMAVIRPAHAEAA